MVDAMIFLNRFLLKTDQERVDVYNRKVIEKHKKNIYSQKIKQKKNS